MIRHYIREKDGTIRIVDLWTWAAWMENGENRRIARDDLGNGIEVSTVFLSLDHDWTLKGPPILFETMIFGGKYDQAQFRYRTEQEALEGHAAAIRMVKADEN